MKFTPKDVQKFQEGGPMPAEAPMDPAAAPEGGVPEEGGGEDPLVALGQAAAQALQGQDCQMAMEVCQGVVALIQQMSGGAPAEPQGEPVFKKGGKLLRRIKK